MNNKDSNKLLLNMKQNVVEAGIDEAGRGSLSGPVTAACVILGKDFDVTRVNDSKKLSRSQRHEMLKYIKDNCIAYGVAAIDNNRIDDINILNATYEAMHKSIFNMESKFEISPEHILVDGNKFKAYKNIPHTTVVKGDATYASIAAASILAKEYHDFLMRKIAIEYPEYGWDSNVGYGTKKHREAIVEHGVSKYHRVTFLGNIIKRTDDLF